MKYFIEHLLEKNLLKKEMLLEAIFEQLSRTPAASEVAFRRELLSHDQLIEICFHQSRENTSFQASCEALQFWSKELGEKIALEMEKMTPPLTQILLQRGFISPSALTENYDLYLNGNKSDSPPNLKTVDKNPVLAELISEDWIAEVQRSVQKITLIAGDEELKSLFESFRNDFHKIRGVGRYVKITEIEHLAESMEILLIATAKSQLKTGELKAVAESLEQNLLSFSEFTGFTPLKRKAA